MRASKWLLRSAIGVAVLVIFVAGYVWVLRRQNRADIADGQMPGTLELSSLSVPNGEEMPRRLTCDGANLSPELHWPSIPAGAKSLALVMDDADAPLGFVHWLLYDIPPGTLHIEEGASPQGGLPPGAAEGANSSGANGYYGPCPPGAKPHQYVFKLYALDINPSLPPGKNKKELAAAVKGHILAEGQTTGLYARGGQ
jgi:Raf kinase inhibitor-like YbhB/YbcL family protein